MENGKVFELLEKFYGEFSQFRKETETGLKEIKKTVINIENDHGDKLKALFDGYYQHTDMLKRIEDEVSRHEEVILRKVKRQAHSPHGAVGLSSPRTACFLAFPYWI